MLPTSLPRPVRKVYRHAYRALFEYGLPGTARILTDKARRLWQPAHVAVDDFDERFGVDTAGAEDLADLDLVDTTHALHGHRHGAAQVDQFHRLIAKLRQPLDEAVFLDIGSGKGRALLLASDYPFRRIIGVEFARDLDLIANRNLAVYRNPAQRCFAIETCCMDALRFEFQPEPTVLFLGNPFTASVMAPFLARVEQSLEQRPRPFEVLYRIPTCADLWDASPAFTQVERNASYAIYRARRE